MNVITIVVETENECINEELLRNRIVTELNSTGIHVEDINVSVEEQW